MEERQCPLCGKPSGNLFSHLKTEHHWELGDEQDWTLIDSHNSNSSNNNNNNNNASSSSSSSSHPHELLPVLISFITNATCINCNKTFPSTSALLKHMKRSKHRQPNLSLSAFASLHYASSASSSNSNTSTLPNKRKREDDEDISMNSNLTEKTSNSNTKNDPKIDHIENDQHANVLGKIERISKKPKLTSDLDALKSKCRELLTGSLFGKYEESKVIIEYIEKLESLVSTDKNNNFNTHNLSCVSQYDWYCN